MIFDYLVCYNYPSINRSLLIICEIFCDFFPLNSVRIRFRGRFSNRMEASGVNSDAHRGSLASTSTSDHHYHHPRRQNGNNPFSASNFFRSPVCAFLEYMGILQTQSIIHSDSSGSLINSGRTRNDSSPSMDDSSEVSIRIAGSGEQNINQSSTVGTATQSESLVHSISRAVSAATMDTQGDSRSDQGGAVSGNGDVESADGIGVNNSRDSTYQRYDLQQAARLVEQVLPFSLLLLVVFIRQHFEGIAITLFLSSSIYDSHFLFVWKSTFSHCNCSLQEIPDFLVTIWIAAFMFKSNDILRKQTALKVQIILYFLMFLFCFPSITVSSNIFSGRKEDSSSSNHFCFVYTPCGWCLLVVPPG